MKLVRNKKGQNDFRIEGLTVGKISCLQKAINQLRKQNTGSVITEHLSYFFDSLDIDSIECFGDSHIENEGK